MLDIWSRSIARAAGVETPDNVRIVPATRPPRWRVRDLFTAIATQYRQWRDRRETYHTLAALSDHHLEDIGLHRGMLDRAADDLTHIRFANDNWNGRGRGTAVANDNTPAGRSDMGGA